MHRRICPFVALMALIVIPAFAQQTTIRVATYNVLNFSGNAGTTAWDRLDYYRTILAEIDPDVLIVQEIVNQSGVDLFRDSVLAPNRYLEYGFVGDLDSNDAVMYYDTSKVQYVRGIVHDAVLRDIIEHVVVIRITGDTLHVFTAHFKTGTATEDAEQRAESAGVFRNAATQLPFDHHYLLAGDLNIYTSDEQAYWRLTYIGGLAGELTDPLDRPGDWHDNPDFTDIHTQSTRTRLFGGGANGGVDDRFDFVLISPSLWRHYIGESYTTFGNDGRHRNDSINALPNLAVADHVADALHYASDHLPVYADFLFPVIFTHVSTTGRREPVTLRISPQPANERVTFHIDSERAGMATINVYDRNGEQIVSIIEPVASGEYAISYDIRDLPSGLYNAQLVVDRKPVAHASFAVVR